VRQKTRLQKKTEVILREFWGGLLCCCLSYFSQAAAADWPAGVKEHTFILSDAAGNFHYFIATSHVTKSTTSVLIVLHGYPRDVSATLNAALQAEHDNPAARRVPIIAPLFQVSIAQSSHCDSPDLPAALPADTLWNCHSWLDGGLDSRGKLSAFQAIDQLIAHLKQRWPALRQITLAGFSAGGQFVQHYVAFARPPESVRLRYVIGDPGSWLYFDRRQETTDCPSINDWKYGLDSVPAWLTHQVAGARDRYRAADISYIEGGDDHGKGWGAYYRILDKSCAADSQGRYRLDRGIRYAQYDREVLKPLKPHLLRVVDGCRHDVRCVFSSSAGKQVLFTSSR